MIATGRENLWLLLCKTYIVVKKTTNMEISLKQGWRQGQAVQAVEIRFMPSPDAGRRLSRAIDIPLCNSQPSVGDELKDEGQREKAKNGL